MTGVQCSRAHRLVRFEASGCAAGHEHRTYVCPMRVGSRRCGEVVVVPPYRGVCEPDGDKR